MPIFGTYLLVFKIHMSIYKLFAENLQAMTSWGLNVKSSSSSLDQRFKQTYKACRNPKCYIITLRLLHTILTIILYNT